MTTHVSWDLILGGLGKKTVIKIIKQDDPNQLDLGEKMQKETLEEIRKIIDGIREKNKGTIILAKQKDLTVALQQIEEILR